ncbi:MAG: hypothetical protein AAF911_08420 [Planctomycetota bacterium]
MTGITRNRRVALSGLITQGPIQRIVFSFGGFGVTSNAEMIPRPSLRPWTGLTGFRLSRINAKWCLLQLGTVAYPVTHQTEHEMKTILFEAGIYCLKKHTPRIENTLARLVHESMRD